jgi:hypothetical protein
MTHSRKETLQKDLQDCPALWGRLVPLAGYEYLSRVRVNYDLRLESYLAQKCKPRRARKQSEDMLFVLDPGGLAVFTKHIGHFYDALGVLGIGIMNPLEISQAATIPVMTAMIGGGLEGLANVIGDEQSDTPRAAMDRGGLQRPPQICSRRHVLDGIVHEDRIELPSETQRAHVAFDVFALRVQRTAHGEHIGRQVGQRHLRNARLR